MKRDGNWLEFKREQNLVNNLIKRKKKKVISEIITKKIDAKPVWDALRVCRMRDSSLLENTCLTPDDFNKHFTSIARTIYKTRKPGLMISMLQQVLLPKHLNVYSHSHRKSVPNT